MKTAISFRGIVSAVLVLTASAFAAPLDTTQIEIASGLNGALTEAEGKVGVWTKADSVTLFDDFHYGEK